MLDAVQSATLEDALLQLRQLEACTLVVLRVELRFGLFGRRQAADFCERLREEVHVAELERALCELPGDEKIEDADEKGEREEKKDRNEKDDESPAELRAPRGCALVELLTPEQEEEKRQAAEEAAKEKKDEAQPDGQASEEEVAAKEQKEEEDLPQMERRALLELLTERWLLDQHSAASRADELVAIDLEAAPVMYRSEPTYVAEAAASAEVPWSPAMAEAPAAQETWEAPAMAAAV